MKKFLLALVCVPLLFGASGCGERDQATVQGVDYNANGPKGEQWVLHLKYDDGHVGIDGPYFVKRGIGKCAAGQRWPSCLKR